MKLCTTCYCLYVEKYYYLKLFLLITFDMDLQLEHRAHLCFAVKLHLTTPVNILVALKLCQGLDKLSNT